VSQKGEQVAGFSREDVPVGVSLEEVAPSGRDRERACSSCTSQVVEGVTDVGGMLSADSEPMASEVDAVGRRLDLIDLVASDEHFDEVPEPGMLELHLSGTSGRSCENSESESVGLEGTDCLKDSSVDDREREPRAKVTQPALDIGIGAGSTDELPDCRRP
jgi:hypothetical protein